MGETSVVHHSKMGRACPLWVIRDQTLCPLNGRFTPVTDQKHAVSDRLSRLNQPTLTDAMPENLVVVGGRADIRCGATK
jgi:hypothetical protein